MKKKLAITSFVVGLSVCFGLVMLSKVRVPLSPIDGIGTQGESNALEVASSDPRTENEAESRSSGDDRLVTDDPEGAKGTSRTPSSNRRAVQDFVKASVGRKIPLDNVRDVISGPGVEVLCEMLSDEKNPKLSLHIVNLMGGLQDYEAVSIALIDFYERVEPWKALSSSDVELLARAKFRSLSSLGLTRTSEAKAYLKEIVYGNGQEIPQESVEAICEDYDLTEAGLAGFARGKAAYGLCLVGSREERDKVSKLISKQASIVKDNGNPNVYDLTLPDDVQFAVNFISAASSGLAGFDMIEQLGLDGYLRLRIEDADGFRKMMPYHMRHYRPIAN